MSERDRDPNPLRDHYAGPLDWPVIVCTVGSVVTLLLLGGLAGTIFGDSRGYARGYAAALADCRGMGVTIVDLGNATEAERVSGAAELVVLACRQELSELQRAFNQHIDQDQAEGVAARLPCALEAAETRGWERGYAVGRDDWGRRPFLPDYLPAQPAQ